MSYQAFDVLTKAAADQCKAMNRDQLQDNIPEAIRLCTEPDHFAEMAFDLLINDLEEAIPHTVDVSRDQLTLMFAPIKDLLLAEGKKYVADTVQILQAHK